MKAFTVQIDDEAAEAYVSQAQERGTSVEALMSSMLLEGADTLGDLLTSDQIAAIEAGLAAEREGRVVSHEEAERRLAARRAR